MPSRFQRGRVGVPSLPLTPTSRAQRPMTRALCLRLAVLRVTDA